MGINRNVSRSIVFGPKHLGGIAIIHIHTLQGICRLQYLVGHIMNNDGVGDIRWIYTKATQLDIGTFEPFIFL
jgi:hypothetical protein